MEHLPHDSSERSLQQAITFWHEGRVVDAKIAFEAAIAALAPDAAAQHQVDIKAGYALCLCEVGAFSEALTLYPTLEDFCRANAIDTTRVTRQWAKALEQTGDFNAARAIYARVKPDADTSPMDKLKWHHAVGLLDWRQGRLSEARSNLAQAVENMPADPAEAIALLSVYGNTALLALELGDTPLAFRLADRMHHIHGVAGPSTVSTETNFIRVQAALAQRRGDIDAVVETLRRGVDLLARMVPDNWAYRLDLAGDFAIAGLDQTNVHDAIAYVTTLCASAPEDLAWYGRYILCSLHLRAGNATAGKENLVLAMAAILGSDSVEGEVSFDFEVSNLCALEGNAQAAVLMGKRALVSVARMAGHLGHEELHKIMSATSPIADAAVKHLRALGRYAEAQLIGDLHERIKRQALILRKPLDPLMLQDLVPFDAPEQRALSNWEEGRANLARQREAGDIAAARAGAEEMIAGLMAFTSSSGLSARQTSLPTPPEGTLRLRFVSEGVTCVVCYDRADGSETRRLEIATSEFFSLVAELRESLSDLDAWKAPAQHLSDLLIAPLGSALKEITCLEIDATGVFGLIPFYLLPVGTAQLVDVVTIQYVLDVAAPPAQGSDRTGLLHCTIYDADAGVGRLDAHHHQQPVEYVSGSEFSRDAFLAGLAARPALVSVVTHLESVPTRPDLSALWLGTDEPLYLSDFGRDAFDLGGVEVALFATCSSALDDVAHASGPSLAAIILEKGARHFIGTLWDVSQSATMEFVSAYWAVALAEPTCPPEEVLRRVQADYAQAGRARSNVDSGSGGIGHRARTPAPEDWAAFAIFQSCNAAQPDAHPA